MKSSNTLEEYLAQWNSYHQITLVGPLFKESKRFSDPVVFVDGGTSHRSTHKEGFSIGDGDSSKTPLDENLESKKDYSDLSYALCQLTENFNNLQLFGFLGGRRDHELINFSEVHNFLKTRKQTKVAFEKEVIALSFGEWTLDYKGSFSVFTFEKAEVNVDGDVEYKTSSRELKALSSHGLSNNASGKIRISCSGPSFLFFNDAI